MSRPSFSGFSTRLTLQSIFIGMFLAISNYLISWGTSYLPISTSSLLLSSQLAFNLVFSIAMVKQKVTFTNLNCVILLTLSSVLLALSSSDDRPLGLTRRDRWLPAVAGFNLVLGWNLAVAGLYTQSSLCPSDHYE
ncbi:purine permease 4 [Perilla frutescens var. hirtella]|uniref:Purine permease 4 n=1 Tax=Perilla frutescens var. hirtella TaxID=608512 RepID=A0AAD4J9Z3_PERFH|nr:purine permease 4 [Perilla frutescens var. hirtella]